MNITPTSPFERAKARNTWKTCAASGCSSTRYGLDAYCRPHQTRHRRYGSPTGAPVDPRHWIPYRVLVQELFTANADHPGLQAALQWLDLLIAQAKQSPESYRGAEEVDRIARHGVTSLALLVEVAAFWCYLSTNPRTLSTDQERDVALSRAVFNLAPRPVRMSRNHLTGQMSRSVPKARRSALGYIGAHLRVGLSRLLVNVAEAVKARPAAKVESVAAMSQPFGQPLAAFVNERANAPE